MDRKEFVKRYENWCDEMFQLGQEADRIIEELVKKHSGKIDTDTLYGGVECAEWISVEPNLQVSEIYESEIWGICLLVEDEFAEVFSKNLSDLAPDERIDIANRLIELNL